MNIFTSCWFSALPPEIQKIGVSRGTPRGYPAGYRKLMKLAPGPWFNKASVSEYKQLYFEDLARLDPKAVIAEIEKMSDGRDAALLCYEKPERSDQWCHRAYISVWFKDTLGLDVFEYGMEERGGAWYHPKIPEQYRLGLNKPAALDVTAYVGATAIDSLGRSWTVQGNDPENADQAMIVSGERTSSISADTLQRRFKPAAGANKAGQPLENPGLFD